MTLSEFMALPEAQRRAVFHSVWASARAADQRLCTEASARVGDKSTPADTGCFDELLENLEEEPLKPKEVPGKSALTPTAPVMIPILVVQGIRDELWCVHVLRRLGMQYVQFLSNVHDHVVVRQRSWDSTHTYRYTGEVFDSFSDARKAYGFTKALSTCPECQRVYTTASESTYFKGMPCASCWEELSAADRAPYIRIMRLNQDDTFEHLKHRMLPSNGEQHSNLMAYVDLLETQIKGLEIRLNGHDFMWTRSHDDNLRK